MWFTWIWCGYITCLWNIHGTTWRIGAWSEKDLRSSRKFLDRYKLMIDDNGKMRDRITKQMINWIKCTIKQWRKWWRRLRRVALLLQFLKWWFSSTKLIKQTHCHSITWKVLYNYSFAPLAPHMAEEIWAEIRIHRISGYEPWPTRWI